MSSTYDVFCLSHDPAVSAVEDAASADEALNRASRLRDHRDCDLVVGRYSGALVEVGCPGAATSDAGVPGHRGHGGWHRDTVWADAKLLRVAAAALAPTQINAITQALEPLSITQALERLEGWCWNPQRLHRLRYVLGAVPSPQEDADA